MTTARFNTRPLLGRLNEVLSLGVMAGLTVAGAAALASVLPVSEPQSVVRLPSVEVSAKPAPVRLPTVVVVGKRASHG
jgi:hypothetical protein